MNNTRLFTNYLNKLEKLNKTIPSSSSDEKIKGKEAEYVNKLMIYLSKDFDRFKSILDSIEFDNFSHRFSQLLEGYKGRNTGYLRHNDYRKLQIENLVLFQRIQRNTWKKLNPFYWLGKLFEWILQIPYNIVSEMGFDPNKFIETTWGKFF